MTDFLRSTGVGRDELARVMRALLECKDAWQVAGRSNVPFADLVEILQALRARGLLWFKGSECALTTEGRAFAKELGADATEEVVCPVCAGSGVEFEPFAEAFAEFAPLVTRRPPAEATYDQGALTPESVFRRLSIMYANGDVLGKRILLLGDDDLLSIALALTGAPREVVVVEIDPRLCDFIEEVATARDLHLRVIRHDVRERLPANLRAQFDTFVTDPSETIQGLLLFVEKGLAMLAPGGGRAGYFGITLIEASLVKWNLWERHLLQNHALVFTHISEPFSLYAKGTEPGSGLHIDLPAFADAPRAPWYRSSFFRIQTLKEFVPPADYDTNPRDELYQDAESLEEAWAVLARGEASSPIAIPEAFLNASAQRAAQAQYGLGRHVIAEFWNCENAQSENGLAEAIEDAVRAARATLLDLQIRRFYPQGYSAIALLAESHLSLHAWPELGYVALDVFTCGEADPQRIVNELQAHFRPGDTEYIKLPRGRRRGGSVAEGLAMTERATV